MLMSSAATMACDVQPAWQCKSTLSAVWVIERLGEVSSWAGQQAEKPEAVCLDFAHRWAISAARTSGVIGLPPLPEAGGSRRVRFQCTKDDRSRHGPRELTAGRWAGLLRARPCGSEDISREDMKGYGAVLGLLVET